MKSLKLPPDLRIQSATTVRDRLLRALEGSGPLRLQGGAVERVDTAGVQLLVAAKAEAGRRGRELQLVAPSTALAEGLAGLGFASLFSLPEPRADRAAK